MSLSKKTKKKGPDSYCVLKRTNNRLGLTRSHYCWEDVNGIRLSRAKPQHRKRFCIKTILDYYKYTTPSLESQSVICRFIQCKVCHTIWHTSWCISESIS